MNLDSSDSQQGKFNFFKLLRAYGGCLGTKKR